MTSRSSARAAPVEARRRAPRRGSGRTAVVALLVLCLGVGALATPPTSRAQETDASDAPPDTGLVVLATTVMALDAALGVWIATMPWRGFWNNRAQADDPIALVLGGVAGVGVGVVTALLARDSGERMAALLLSGAGALELELGVLIFGGLYHLMAPPGACEEGCTKLLFGLAPWLGTLVGLSIGLVHLAIE
ncbi:MAG: hypothetical protein IT379_10020 [Deltaproteobacteria bacterium]|nr:hypothetical protein [Deltaproteobacteria bacterium]